MKWFKKSASTYEDETIKIIETMPECDSILVIWDKLLCLAAKGGSSRLILKGRIPYTAEMLAALFNRPVETVELALNVFLRYDMVEVDSEHVFTICNWAKHQAVDGSPNKNAERQKRWRDKHRQEATDEEAQVECEICNSEDTGVTDNALRVTGRNVTRNVTRNALEIEIEKELEEESKDSCRAEVPDSAENAPAFSVGEVVDLLNTLTGSSFKASSKATQRHIRARQAEGYTLEDFRAVVEDRAKRWGRDPKMAQYLRPDTLFGAKFESYLQAARACAPPKDARIEAEYGNEEVWRSE